MQLCLKCRAIIPVGKRVCEKCGTPAGATSISSNSVASDLLERAKKRDVNAMVQLAVYYLALDPRKLVDGEYPGEAAQKWYEKAALAGNGSGIDYILKVRSELIESKEEETGPVDAELIQLKRDLFSWCQCGEKLFNSKAPGSEKISHKSLMKQMERSKYSLAYSLYFSGEKKEAHSLVVGKSYTPSAILDSLINNIEAMRKAVHPGAPTESEIEEVMDTLMQMRFAIYNNAYGFAPKTSAEEYIYVLTALQIAVNHTFVFEECFKAYSVLQYVLPFLKTERARSMIEDELRHYVVIGEETADYVE